MRIIALVTLLLATQAAAEPCGPVYLGEIDLGTSVSGFAGDGTVAYVASESGLHVIDASEPGVPAVSNFLSLPQSSDVCTDGNLLYLLGDLGLYLVLDITDPLAPRAIGTGLASGDPDQIVADGSLALTVDRRTRVTVLDVIDPVSPTVAGHIDRLSVEDADLDGSTAYLLTDRDGGEIEAYDLSSPASPTLIGSWNVSECANDLIADDGLLFVSTCDGIQSYDTSNPAELRLLDTLPGIAGGLSFAKDHLAAHSSGSSSVVDVTDPSDLRLVVSGRAPQDSEGVGGIVNDRALFWNRQRGRFNVLDVSVPNAIPVGRLQSQYRFTSLANAGDTFFAADFGGVMIIDVSDLNQPAPVGYIPTNDPPNGMAAHGDLLYITAGQSGLIIVDVSNPATPETLGTIPATGNRRATDVKVRWPFAYLAQYSGGVSAAYVANPENPFIINTEGVFGDAYRIELKGSTMYVNVVLPVRWATVDITNAGEPDLLARGPFPIWGGIEFLGELVLLTTESGIHVMEELPDASLERVAIAELPIGVDELDRSGSLVLATSAREMYLVDLTDPLGPEFVSAISPAPADGDDRAPFSFYDSVWHNGYIVAATDMGLYVFNPTPCGGCISDLTRDGSINLNDVERFVIGYLDGSILADFDGNNEITLDDLDAFIAAFLSGCP